MDEEIYLDQKGTTILVGVFLALLVLVFAAGWLTGALVGLPAVEQPAAPAPVAKKAVRPEVVALKVPPAVEPEPPAQEDEPILETEALAPIAAEDVASREQRPNSYAVQVASFEGPEKAEQMAAALQEKGYDAIVRESTGADGRKWFAVRLGFDATREESLAKAADYREREKAEPMVLKVYNPQAPQAE